MIYISILFQFEYVIAHHYFLLLPPLHFHANVPPDKTESRANILITPVPVRILYFCATCAEVSAEGCRFSSRTPGPFCVEFVLPVAAWVLSSFLPRSKNMHVWSIAGWFVSICPCDQLATCQGRHSKDKEHCKGKEHPLEITSRFEGWGGGGFGDYLDSLSM